MAVNGSSPGPAKDAVTASVPRPTPADFAGRKATLPVLPKPVDHRLARPPELVYSSTTGVGSVDHQGLSPDDALIDEVVRGVVDTWKKTITEGERRTVVSERPNIPRELDKALLVDLSDRLGVYDIDERSRFVLRERFWKLLD